MGRATRQSRSCPDVCRIGSLSQSVDNNSARPKLIVNKKRTFGHFFDCSKTKMKGLVMYEETWSTKEVSKILSIPIARLSRIVWEEKCHAPTKNEFGHYRWNRSDINLAAWDLGRQRFFDAWDKSLPELTPPADPRDIVIG